MNQADKKRVLARNVNWKLMYLKGNTYLTYELKTGGEKLYRVLVVKDENGVALFEELYTNLVEAIMDFNYHASFEGGNLVNFKKNRAKQKKREAEKYSDIARKQAELIAI